MLTRLQKWVLGKAIVFALASIFLLLLPFVAQIVWLYFWNAVDHYLFAVIWISFIPYLVYGDRCRELSVLFLKQTLE